MRSCGLRAVEFGRDLSEQITSGAALRRRRRIGRDHVLIFELRIAHEIAVDQHAAAKYLARPRVPLDLRFEKTAAVGFGQPADRVVPNVVGVPGGVGRLILHFDGILDADALERTVPCQDSIANRARYSCGIVFVSV